MKVLNKIEIVNQDILINLNQEITEGLLTFSNHNSLFDDPFLISCSAPIQIEDRDILQLTHKISSAKSYRLYF